MNQLPECKRDLKKINVASVCEDLASAEGKIESLSLSEFFQMTQTKRLARVGQCVSNNKLLVIHKLRWGTTNPKKSARDGLRIWFCTDELGEKTTCLIQKADKNHQSQAQTLDEVKRRLKNI